MFPPDLFMDIHVVKTAADWSVNTLVVPLAGNKVFIVDPGCSEVFNDEDVVVSFLKEHNYEPVAIVLTHGHFDHVIGLPVLKKAFPELPIAIHNLDKDFIGKNSISLQNSVLVANGWVRFLRYVTNLPEPDFLLEDRKTLNEILSLKSSDKDLCDALAEWQVLHTPGHSRGSVCLYNESKSVLISGDTIFYRARGRTDMTGGSKTRIMDSIGFLDMYCKKETVVYPGHDFYGFKMGENVIYDY